jgi:hypothetical protein
LLALLIPKIGCSGNQITLILDAGVTIDALDSVDNAALNPRLSAFKSRRGGFPVL